MTNISGAKHCLYLGLSGFTQSRLAAVTELIISELNGLDWTGEWGVSIRSLPNLRKVTLDSQLGLHGFSRDNGKRHTVDDKLWED